MKNSRNQLHKVPKYVVMLILCFMMLFPFYVLTYVAVNDKTNPLSNGVFRLPKFTLDNFTRAWKSSLLGQASLHSLYVTLLAIIVVIIFSANAAYVIARYPNKFHKTLFWLFMSCMMVPAIVNTVPLYSIMRSINGINNLTIVALLLSAYRIPYCIFLYESFIETMPREMEEAAIVDGCTPYSAFWYVTFPLLKPVTSTVIITSALFFWNNYSQVVFFLQKKKVYTLPLAVQTFVYEHETDWPLVAAATLISILPVVIVYLLLQKNFIKGLTAGAVKG